VATTLRDRLRGLLRLRRQDQASSPGLVDDGSLRLIGGSRDPARPDSQVVAGLAEAGLDLSRPVLLVHLLRLPTPDSAAECARLVAEEGYTVRSEPDVGGGLTVRVSRAQRLSGLSVAQERSRMAGLAQRLGGDVDGWEALGVPTA
jgi:hypothetical protein